MIIEPTEVSVMEVCVSRSKQIAQMKKALILGKAFKTEMLKCSKRFPSEDKLMDLITEFDNSIMEYKMDIAKLLRSILAQHGIILDLTYWFTLDEIRSGYVLLRTPNSLGATHVLFLKDHIDSFDNSTILRGEVKLWKHVNHFLERLDANVELKKVQQKSKKDE